MNYKIDRAYELPELLEDKETQRSSTGWGRGTSNKSYDDYNGGGGGGGWGRTPY
jgi:hypothetical protein